MKNRLFIGAFLLKYSHNMINKLTIRYIMQKQGDGYHKEQIRSGGHTPTLTTREGWKPQLDCVHRNLAENSILNPVTNPGW